jgi:hypothetical protein
MTLFVAIINDRHRDPIIRVFSDRAIANAWAEKNFKACPSYDFENDRAWIEEVELDDESDVEG